MPMFDDPKKELKRLEEELLAEESGEDLGDLDELLKDYESEDLENCFEEEAEADEDFSRPGSPKDFSRVMSEMLLDEDDDDFEAVKPKKQKGITGLVILCVLETLAIVGLLAWWYLCLR